MRPAGPRDGMDWRMRLYRAGVRSAMLVYVGLLRLALRRKRRAVTEGPVHVLLTGTFHSDNWIRAHLGPLAASGRCARVTMVTTTPLPALDKVHAVRPSPMLTRLVGGVPARLLTFAAVAARERPDVVGGFHLLVNGLAAILVGRALGLRCWYFSVGGPVELLDGGAWGENPHFARLRTPDAAVERRLIEAVAGADLVVTMGSGAREFLRGRGVTTDIEVVPGGIAPEPSTEAPHDRFDLVLVARLVPIKQIDRFVELVRLLNERRAGSTAVIVGDGPLRPELEAQTRAAGLEERITFAGFQPHVTPWLRQSRVFALTSRSEGLALSLMEAMTCGLPAVVPDVGDLGDLVEEGANGFLVPGGDPVVMADRVLRILDGVDTWRAFSDRARRSAERYSAAATTARWDRLLAGDETG